MTSKNFWRTSAPLLALAATLTAQIKPVLTIETIAPLTVPKRGEATITLPLIVANGYHMNSNAPKDEYLIPLKLTWDATPLQLSETVYPAPKMEKFGFSEQPLSIYDGTVLLKTKVKAGKAPAGDGTLTGRLRYQACTNDACLPPKTVPVSIKYSVK